MRVRPAWLLIALFVASCAAAYAQAVVTLAPLTAPGPITYFVDEGTKEAAYRPGDRQLAVWALEAWARMSDGMLRFEPAPVRDAMIQVNWVPAGDGQYGEMRAFLVNGRRGAAVYIRPDTDGLGPDIARLAREDTLVRDTIVYLTCVHELGHALGLSHTSAFADIMYFFGFGGDIPTFFGRYRGRLSARTDIPKFSGLSAADVNRLRALYPRK
jgi:matrixin